MPQNKAAARVLEHPNGLDRELTKTHKIILLHFVRFGKLFAKTCAVTLTLLGLAAFAGAVQIRRFGQVFAALVYTHQATQAMPNRHYIDRWYYGRLLIVGWRSNRMTDLPHDLAEELCRKWAKVEVQV